MKDLTNKGGFLMIQNVWSRMWDWHDEAKRLFTFFIRPNQTMMNSDGSGAPFGYMEKDPQNERNKRSYTTAQLIGLIAGPLLFFLILLFFNPEGLTTEARAILAATIWMAAWWITEAVPIPVTSLLPLVLFPLAGGLDVKATASAYGDENIFLFMGGFMIALAMEKWNLHRRIALTIISAIGTNMNKIVLGFMVATGFLSMWISNTATAMMMVPIGLAITYQVADALKNSSADTSKENFGFGKALMLGIAYSASVGGISTLIGTPPNTALAAAMEKMYGIEISFGQWMLFGTPFAWLFILLIWVYLVKVAYPQTVKELPGGREVIHAEKQKLGAASAEEKLVFTIFILAALSWITRSFFLQEFLPGISDGVIAMFYAIALFAIPAVSVKGDRLLDWETAVKLPWGILLLFGGGLAIAAGFVGSGLSEWIGSQLTALDAVPLLVIIIVVTALVIFLTEITSNTATAAMMYPIMGALAIALDVHPFALMVAAGVAASCAFMLPVATPPNAVVFGSGYLRIPDMAKAGLALNIMGVILVPLFIWFLLPVVFGIDLNTVPELFK